MAIRSSILAWNIPWTEEPGRLPSKGQTRQRAHAHAHTHTHTQIPYKPQLSMLLQVNMATNGLPLFFFTTLSHLTLTSSIQTQEDFDLQDHTLCKAHP